MPDSALDWDRTRRKKWSLVSKITRTAVFPSFRYQARMYPPLSGDEIDVVSQSRVVSGHVLCWRVLARIVRLGGVPLSQNAQTHEQR